MATSLHIQNFIVLLGGFTQHAGEDTGMMRLWARLFHWRDSRTRTRTMIMPREWDDDVDAMAAMVKRHASSAAPPRIVIIGYSYGGGWTAPRLARSLARDRFNVDLMVLIDPVWRSRLISGKWLSFTGAIDIAVPANVRNVISWRQRNGALLQPRGSRLSLDDESATRIILEVDVSLLELDHASIQYDDDILDAAFHHTIHLIQGVERDASISHHPHIVPSDRGPARDRAASARAATRFDRAGRMDRRRDRTDRDEDRFDRSGGRRRQSRRG